MKTRPLFVGFLLIALLGGLFPSEARNYVAGDIITNFAIYTRRPWTNSVGKAFAPGSQIKLSDFAGKIIFLEFFDPT
jgi:hypothetical protein